MEKRKLQRKRIMSYFIEGAEEIIKKEGLKGISIRKVADLAGYNSATLYNYFENLDHLVFFAAMKHIKPYAQALPNYIKNASNALEKYFLIWKCFCEYSFKDPEIYYAIFFAKLNNDLADYVNQYYDIFPEDLGNQPKEISTMLLKSDIYDRDLSILTTCVKEGFINRLDVDEVNEVTLLVYQGLLLKVMNKKIEKDEATKKTMKYVKKIIDYYVD